MTATDTDETMRRLEETTTAAMVGWAKAATEVERLTAERDAALTQCTEAERLIRALTDQRDQAMATRDHARAALGFVRALADEWEQVIDENAFSADWTACLRANLPALRDAIDGGRT